MSSAGSCLVQGRYLRVVADGIDADRDPDWIPVSDASIVFTPKLKLAKTLYSDPPAIFGINPVEASTWYSHFGNR